MGCLKGLSRTGLKVSSLCSGDSAVGAKSAEKTGALVAARGLERTSLELSILSFVAIYRPRF